MTRPGAGLTRTLVLAVCALLFTAGAVGVWWALRGASPDATPVPDEEF